MTDERHAPVPLQRKRRKRETFPKILQMAACPGWRPGNGRISPMMNTVRCEDDEAKWESGRNLTDRPWMTQQREDERRSETTGTGWRPGRNRLWWRNQQHHKDVWWEAKREYPLHDEFKTVCVELRIELERYIGQRQVSQNPRGVTLRHCGVTSRVRCSN